MIRIAFILLIVIPAVEIFGIIQMAQWVGGWNTFLLIILTGIIGAVVARFEGGKVIEDMRAQMQAGQVPGRSMIDGLCVFAGGIIMVVPGFVTDIVGFTLVFPLTRPLYRAVILKYIEKKMKDGHITFYRRP